MRLAKEFGEKDWRAFAEGMSAQQLMEWREFWRWEPFGQEWEQAGVIAHTVAAAAGTKTLKVRDFMPCAEPEREGQSEASIQGTIAAFFSARVGNGGSGPTSDSGSG